MSKKGDATQKALDNLDDQVVQLVGDFVKRRKAHYEQAAKRLHAELKKDTLRYAAMLEDQKISQEDFELLLSGRAAQIKIELLGELSMSKAKFEDIAGALLKLTVKTVIEVV